MSNLLDCVKIGEITAGKLRCLPIKAMIVDSLDERLVLAAGTPKHN